MAFEKELQFLKEQKKTVIARWFSSLNREDDIYPEQIDITERLRVANLFIDFIADFHIEAETHPFIISTREWSKKNYQQHRSFSSILNVNDKLKDAFINVFIDYENSKDVLKFLEVLFKRQNIFFREYCESHMKISLELLNEKDSKIDKLHNDRLNLIGKMASSMAHEIRNPLTAIAGFLKLIRQDILNRGQTQLQKYIDVIDDEFNSINMHITGFLSFSRNKAFEEKKIEISIMDLFNSTLFLLNPRLTNENIHLTINNIENCKINIQKISIQQVMSNIISNAIDALITVKFDKLIRIVSFQDEEYVYIHITNNGPEIPNEIRNLLFIPFMTNKENGTGLGLAICREIMTKNNGEIEFESNEKETNFILSFKKKDKKHHMSKS
ncbi:sensor histidine kinase [Paenibacillus psychroresistens]|nr:HAMP domain-containing sensor histidine kinase [Paenibacillus psychroresistens]